MQTVVPQHLELVNGHQREVLRFSNGIANTGDGPWRMRPEFPATDITQPQKAYQQVLDASGNVVAEYLVSEFQFHPEHKHWHIARVALFEVRQGSPDGPVFGDRSIKTTFCLIDWYRLEGNSKTPERTYFECNGELQGVSPGWADQYHQSLEGQDLDITGTPPGLYYLVSTTNPDGNFVEKDLTNNTAWVAFALSRDSNGNPKIKIMEHSPCSGALCGDAAPNR